jgi:hypothetical protein
MDPGRQRQLPCQFTGVSHFNGLGKGHMAMRRKCRAFYAASRQKLPIASSTPRVIAPALWRGDAREVQLALGAALSGRNVIATPFMQ